MSDLMKRRFGEEEAPSKKLKLNMDAAKAAATDMEDPLFVIEITPYLKMTITHMNDVPYVDLRHFQVKDGRLVPTKKGIFLNLDQVWELDHHIRDISEALRDGKNIKSRFPLKKLALVTIDPDYPGVDIRKYFIPDGMTTLKPSQKGVHMNPSEWSKVVQLLNALPALLPEYQNLSHVT